MSVFIDKALYNDIVSAKIENEDLISEIYTEFNNYTMQEKQSAIEIIYNLNIINEEYAKYIVIYNNAISDERQTAEYITMEEDTFQRIAQVTTGDFNNWKAIMDFNNIKDPYLESGTVILVPLNL